MLADLPFSATRLIIFDIIIYFMTNLSRSAGGFFTFHLFQYVAFLAMQVDSPEHDMQTARSHVLQSFFRLFGILCSNFDTAFRYVRHNLLGN
jgi:ATP-binding cassette subfamily G (WHITE) protein 2 (SNQ2)